MERERRRQEEKERRQQQQEAERERQGAASIEQQQRIEEHQEALNGPSKKRKRATNPNHARHFNESTAHIPSCLKEEYPRFV